MEKKIAEFLKMNNLIIDKTVICAVSGGADSLMLLHVLYNIGYKVVLAHVNHHKRIESEEEQKAMEDLAKSLNIPFELLSYHYDGLDNFHNDSHNARYNFFKELTKKYDTNIIATAHHQDDQIETVLMKLMEGSNLYGYGGISICNYDGEYKIIRPLLCVNKEEIYSYCKEHNLVYFEDRSNQEDDFLRNRLRHHVVPLLKKECNNLGQKIMEYSIQAHEAFDYIRKQSIDYLDLNNNTININSFNSLNIALKKDILALLLERYDIRKNNEIILNMLAILDNSKGNKKINLEKNYSFIRSYSKAKIEKEKEKNKLSFYMNEKDIIQIGKYKFYFTNSHNNICAKYVNLCYNDLVFPLTIRYRQEGDFIDIGIGNKKISRILIDNKVPKEKRDEVPLVINGNNEILWVYNYAKSKTVTDSKDKGNIYLVCEVIEHDE